MKPHAFFLFVLLLLIITSQAQEHFYPVGNFTDAMNINILEAKVNGIDLESGDEIGIFSGDLCVGNAVLDKTLEGVFDTKTKSAIAGSDDSETSNIDGFTNGAIIVFKFWDASEELEFDVTDVKYFNPNNGDEIAPRTFQIGATAYVSLNSTYNYPPVASAGPDLVLHERGYGQLDGSGSNDLNQDSLRFHWTDLDTFGLSELNVPSPELTAPEISNDKDYRFVLVVNDGVYNSAPDTTIVTVLNVPLPPVANAGADLIQVNEKDMVELDGSKSFDPDGKPITWSWELPESSIEMTSGDSGYASFVAPEVETDSVISAILTVTNSSGLSDSDTVFIKIMNVNLAPVAIAPNDAVLEEGEQLVLDGSNSFDADKGPAGLMYKWKCLNGNSLTDVDKLNAVFTAPFLLADSTFFCTLTVYDGESYSVPDTVLITVLHKNLPPVAVAGEDLVVDEGVSVVIAGNSSYDPEGDTLLFEWFSDYLVFDDVSSSTPVFIAPEQQKDTTVEVILKVSDKAILSGYDTVRVTIRNVNIPPEWVSVPSDTAYPGMEYRGLIEVTDADLYDSISITSEGLPLWLHFIDNGDGSAELIADTVPYSDAFQGSWEFAIQASDGTATIDTTFSLYVTFYSGISPSDLSDFMVFPNPASDWVTIRLEKPVISKTILRIYNMSGNLLHEQLVIQQNTLLSLEAFSRGVYFFEVVTGNRVCGLAKVVVD